MPNEQKVRNVLPGTTVDYISHLDDGIYIDKQDPAQSPAVIPNAYPDTGNHGPAHTANPGLGKDPGNIVWNTRTQS